MSGVLKCLFYVKLYVHSLVDELKRFYENARWYIRFTETCTLLYFVNYVLNEMMLLVGSTAVWGRRLGPKRSDLLFR